MNNLFDRECLPRSIPTPLPAPSRFLSILVQYHTAISELKATRWASAR